MLFWNNIEARTQASHLPLSFFHVILACNHGPTQRLHLDPSSLFFSLNDISLFFFFTTEAVVKILKYVHDA